jgi:hypothetical protein
MEALNVVIEDPDNADIIYVGSDNGLYVSFDRGIHFHSAGASLPAVAVHDLDIQPVASHLLVGTHGRSFYKADISQIQLLTPEMLGAELHVFEIPGSGLRYRESWGTRQTGWSDYYEPQIEIPLYSRTGQQIQLSIVFEDHTVYETRLDLDPGIWYHMYDLTVLQEHQEAYKSLVHNGDPEVLIAESDNGVLYLRKGTYTIKARAGEVVSEQSFVIK